MTPLDRCYVLSESTHLDHTAMMQILSHGHTRVPVYRDASTNVVALLFCKDLLGIGFERQQVPATHHTTPPPDPTPYIRLPTPRTTPSAFLPRRLTTPPYPTPSTRA
jgi:CBS domain containing-hemolysin-like protein